MLPPAAGGPLAGLADETPATLAYSAADLDPHACRRLACAVLLAACLEAHAGNGQAQDYLTGPAARRWAELIDLPHWPPAPAQLANRTELKRRVSAAE